MARVASIVRHRRLWAVAVLLVALCAGVAVASAAGHRHRHHKVRAPFGVAMPVGNLPGWRQVFRDDFSGSSLDRQWWTLRGEPGGGGGGWWDPSHVVVGGGMLQLETSSDPAVCTNASICPSFDDEVSGAVQSAFAQTYGRYEVRLRTSPGANTNVGFIAMLYPANNTWPPEVDFVEEGGSNHATTLGATLTYGPSAATLQRNVVINESKWHTLGVIWTPGELEYTIDGRVWGTVTGAGVPSLAMRISMQVGTACETGSQQLPCAAPFTATEPSVQIAWIVAYAPD